MKNITKFLMGKAIVLVLTLLITQPSCFSGSGENTASTGEHAGDGHDEENHGEENEHENNKVVRLSEAELEEFGIEIAVAESGELEIRIDLPGEIILNENRLAHIVPRVPGVAIESRKNVGDPVRKNETLAVLESRELANAKAELLTARARKALATANYSREKDLWEKKITSEQEYISAKQALAEAEIELRSAELKLHALGFSEKYINNLPTHPDAEFTRYEITAPFAGTVIKKHITIGEMFSENRTVFVIADLSSVWVNFSVYQKDLSFVKKGQPVNIVVGHGITDAKGVISFVKPIVGEDTRTALARVALPNRDGKLRPGLFVTGSVIVEKIKAPLLVPKTAIQIIDNEKTVFVKTKEGFKPRQIKTGRSDQTRVEITSGLLRGEKYAAVGAFTLKAQLSKSSFGEGHGH
ncbi:MAG: secretion protein HlyD [bacterium]|nr:MAG: secretion protein HlyD [bacterium]